MGDHLDVVLALAVGQVFARSGSNQLFGAVHHLTTLQQHLSLDKHSRDVRRAEASYSKSHLKQTMHSMTFVPMVLDGFVPLILFAV